MLLLLYRSHIPYIYSTHTHRSICVYTVHTRAFGISYTHTLHMKFSQSTERIYRCAKIVPKQETYETGSGSPRKEVAPNYECIEKRQCLVNFIMLQINKLEATWTILINNILSTDVKICMFRSIYRVVFLTKCTFTYVTIFYCLYIIR